MAPGPEANGDNLGKYFRFLRNNCMLKKFLFVIWKYSNSADYFSFPLGSLWYLLKWSSALVYVGGRKQCCKLHFCS